MRTYRATLPDGGTLEFKSKRQNLTHLVVVTMTADSIKLGVDQDHVDFLAKGWAGKLGTWSEFRRSASLQNAQKALREVDGLRWLADARILELEAIR